MPKISIQDDSVWPFYLAKLIVDKVHIPLTYEYLARYNGKFVVTDGPPEDKGWSFSWGVPHRSRRHSVMESGFFWYSVHLDRDLYHHASFNSPEAREIVRTYRAPESAANVLRRSGKPQSKYHQHEEDVRWEGIVLPLQQPHDLSITRVGVNEDYEAFVSGAIEHYGRHLLIKMHPMNQHIIYERLRPVAKKHGATIRKTNHSCLEHCKFVLLYNSTFAVDCFVRGVPVAQFAPGYFYQSEAVTYTYGEYPDDVNDTVDMGYCMSDFLIWRYCLVQDMPVAKWIDVLQAHAGSKEMFPLPESLSWGANHRYSAETGVWRF